MRPSSTSGNSLVNLSTLLEAGLLPSILSFPWMERLVFLDMVWQSDYKHKKVKIVNLFPEYFLA